MRTGGWGELRSIMGCEDHVFSMTTTAKESALLSVDLKMLPSMKEKLNRVCMFTLDADYNESQVNDEVLLLESAQQNRRILCREDEFPSSNSLCVVKSRNTSKRAASLDFLEYVLPYDEIAQLGCKSGGKSFWKNLRFWQRTKKSAAASCLSVSSSVQHSDFKLGGHHRPKVTRAKREVLGPLYTDGSSLQSGSKRSNQQHPYAVIDAQALYMCGKSDGKFIPYMRLNRCPRIPPGPLYLP